MALRRCRNCTTAFAVGVNVCPHCGSQDHVEEGAVVDLGEFTKKQLVEEADRRGVDVPSGIRKGDLLALLEAS